MESDLHTIFLMNMLIKYADDTNLLVPSVSDVGLAEEFSHVKQWAAENRMVINILKTKEIVFRRPNPRLYINPVPISEVQQVTTAKLLFRLSSYFEGQLLAQFTALLSCRFHTGYLCHYCMICWRITNK